MARHFTPGTRGRGVTVSAKPGDPAQRGRVLQFKVVDQSPSSSSAASSTEPPVASSGVGGSQMPEMPSNPSSAAQSDVGTGTQETVSLLVMHAVSGWVAVVRERVVYSIQIAPMGGGTFEVEATLAAVGNQGVASEDSADVLYLRVSAALGKGRLVRTEVEPLSPR